MACALAFFPVRQTTNPLDIDNIVVLNDFFDITLQMSLRDVGYAAWRGLSRYTPNTRLSTSQIRHASVATATKTSELDDLEASSSLSTSLSLEDAQAFDPIAQASKRKTRLPASRYGLHFLGLFLDILTSAKDISSVPPSTIVVHYILINHPSLPIQPLANISPAHSVYHA